MPKIRFAHFSFGIDLFKWIISRLFWTLYVVLCLHSLFGPTRNYANDALRAAMAYADIVAAILNAMEAAQDAFEAANKAHNYVSI